MVRGVLEYSNSNFRLFVDSILSIVKYLHWGSRYQLAVQHSYFSFGMTDLPPLLNL